MAANLPTGWQGRLLAALLLLLVLAAAYVAVAAPLRGFYAERELRIANRRALLERLDSVAAELPGLHARVVTLRRTGDKQRLTLDGASDAIASAALQGHVEQYAARAGVTVGSTEILPAEAAGAYRRIGLRLVVSGPYESLIKLLSELETATPPMIVGDLRIGSTRWRQDTHKEAGLASRLEIYGFRAADKPDSAKP